MRGNDDQQMDVFSYISPEERVPQEHPLRPLESAAKMRYTLPPNGSIHTC